MAGDPGRPAPPTGPGTGSDDAGVLRPSVSGRHWALFEDWCVSWDRIALPADPTDVRAFLVELPAGPVTTLRRLRAIDDAHRRAGLSPPGDDPEFDPVLRPPVPARFDPDLVAGALGAVLTGGWPDGLVGRRDAAVVALVCAGRFTRSDARALRAGPGSIRPSPLLVTSAGGPGGCPACALSRWERVHATAASDGRGWRAVRDELADLGTTPADTEMEHDCARPVVWPSGPTLDAPLFSAIDRRGLVDTMHPLSTRSITTIVTGRLAATRPASGLDDGTDEGSSGPWGDDDRRRVEADRREAVARMARFEAMLDDADAYAEAILARVEAGERGLPT